MKPQPSGGFEWVQAPGGPALVCGALRPFADHLFTTRAWALGSNPQTRDEDWQPVATGLGVEPARLARLHQVHGAAVVVRRAGDAPRSPGESLPDADILISNDPSEALTIQTADCVPVLIADRVTGAVAAAHAGWRGLAAGVPGVTVAALARELGSAPADLIAAIGPCISAERYEVGRDVRARFLAAEFSAEAIARWFGPGVRPEHWLFDAPRSARDQLEAAGVRAGNIHSSGLCTATCQDLFCSYRRDGAGAGRLAAAIRGVRPADPTRSRAISASV
jgi:YfiH family protein